MSKQFPELKQNEFYHIYNRGNNREAIFLQPKNYTFFLNRFVKYLCGYVDVFCFCLLKNHFHFLIRVKNFESLPENLKTIKAGIKTLSSPELILSEQFRRFFLSYSKAIVKQEKRTGSLFQKNFQRKIVDTKAYLLDVVKYIHRNPQNHGIVKDYKSYPFSSYHAIVSGLPNTFVRTEEVVSWYGGLKDLIKQHDESGSVDKICHIG